MKNNISLSRMARQPGWRNQQGITLVTTLLLLVLLMGMSLTMVLAVSSESLINGYYGRYRGSFYAADSGVAVARQKLMNNLSAQVPIPFPASPAPIINLVNASQTAQDGLIAAYGAAFVNVNTANSWQERFKVTSAQILSAQATCKPQGGTGGGGTCAAPTFSTSQPITGYVYNFPYTITIVGQSKGSEVATVVDSGTVTLSTPTTPGSYQQSFAAWGMFIGTYALCSADLVPGTITGPVFTNGSWNFSNSGPYSFKDPVGQSGTLAGWDNGGCKQSATATNGINPTFSQGFQTNQSAVTLPANSFNQEQAVLDGVGLTSIKPDNNALNAALKDMSGNKYPTGSNPPGVYLPYSVNPSTGAKTFTGGGIFVQGDAKITLSPGSNGTAQVYTIVNNGVTTYVTVDPAAGAFGTTSISNSPTSPGTVITGVPQQLNSTGASVGDATMVFVNGNITGLSGPGQGQPAIQNGQAISVVASDSNDITVTGDILYKQEPVTMTGSLSQIDELIPANDKGQVLGIFTAGGDVQLKNSQSNGNLEIDASIATISATGSGGIVNVGNPINTLTIVGGRIQNTIQNIGATTRNVLFDRRFLDGFAPPWFPSTTVTPAAGAGNQVIVTWKGTQWLNQTNYQ